MRPVITLSLDGLGTGRLHARNRSAVGSVLTTRTVNGMEVCHTRHEWAVASLTGCKADNDAHTVTHSVKCPVLTSTKTRASPTALLCDFTQIYDFP